MVDSSGHALLRILLQHPISLAETELDAWVDTGFTGELVVPEDQVVALGLPLGPITHAVLAEYQLPGKDINRRVALIGSLGVSKGGGQ